MSKSPVALVVDDEAAVRQLTSIALQQRGFTCDQAEDGEQALQLAQAKNYDAIVTDLRMPRRHGHSFAMEILNQVSPKPILVVLTGVAEPRLALDLLDRGVDDIVLKPVDFRVLAAKVHALCSKLPPKSAKPPLTDHGDRTAASDLNEDALPSELASDDESRRAIEVAKFLRLESREPDTIVGMLNEMPEIGQEVRRTIRWLQFAITKERQANDIEAVRGVDCNVVADLTIAAMLRQQLLRDPNNWIDAEAIYRRSSFATIMLANSIPREKLSRKIDLLIATFLAPLMRPFAARVSAKTYGDLIRECSRTNVSMRVLEKRRGLPSPTKFIKPALIRWGISRAAIELLEFANLSFREVHALRSSLRSDTTRIKLAILLGIMAQGRFDAWDEIDIPSMTLAIRLGFRRPDELIQSTCERYGDIVGCNRKEMHERYSQAQDGQKLRHLRLSSHTASLLEPLLKTMGNSFVRNEKMADDFAATDIINAIDARPERVRQCLARRRLNSRPAIVADEGWSLEFERHCTVIHLPCSAAAFAQKLSYTDAGSRTAAECSV